MDTGSFLIEGGELCNPIPVRDSYSEGAGRKCLRVGRCFDSLFRALEIKRIVPFSEWS